MKGQNQNQMQTQVSEFWPNTLKQPLIFNTFNK